MAFIRPEQSVIEAEGYVRVSNYTDVGDVYNDIARAIEHASPLDVEEDYPAYLYDQRVYKITIKVERA